MNPFITNLDINTFFLLNSVAGNSQFIDFLIIFFANYLAFILPIIFLVLLYRVSSTLREKTLIAVIVLFSALFARFGIVELVRLFYHRPRPYITHDIYQLFSESSYSFPSGHTAFFFAFSFAIYLYNKKLGIWFFIATLFMTIARIMAGVHYPSDIIGGIIIGIVIAFITFRYFGPSFKKIINRFILI